jgi:TPR repeat protein
MSCSQLGVFYSRGKGVDKDPAMAHTLFEKACELGDSSACGK